MLDAEGVELASDVTGQEQVYSSRPLMLSPRFCAVYFLF